METRIMRFNDMLDLFERHIDQAQRWINTHHDNNIDIWNYIALYLKDDVLKDYLEIQKKLDECETHGSGSHEWCVVMRFVQYGRQHGYQRKFCIKKNLKISSVQIVQIKQYSTVQRRNNEVWELSQMCV